MRTSLRKVGNSRGVIIPAKLLAACEMGDEVDIRLEGKNLVIAPVKAPRAGWFDGYKPEADSEPFAALPADEGSEEWVSLWQLVEKHRAGIVQERWIGCAEPCLPWIPH